MSVAFKPGQTLGDADLKIAVRDSTGVLMDPAYIRYSLFDYTTGVEVLMGSADRIPATTGVGLYYVDATIPLDANIGDWIVRWNFRELNTSPMVQVVQEFNIVKVCVQVESASGTGNDTIDALLRRLRIFLRDWNPDRNYRFRPPSHEKFIQAQTQVFGYIWEDEELYEYLLSATDDYNGAPPITDVSLSTLPTRWRTTVCLKAASFACMAIANNWIADEFSVCGDEKVSVKDDDGNVYTLSLLELFSILYGDELAEIEKETNKIIEENKDDKE